MQQAYVLVVSVALGLCKLHTILNRMVKAAQLGWAAFDKASEIKFCMAKIFFNSASSKPVNAYAFLNWYFEDQKNTNSILQNKQVDSIQFYIMGNSYIASSLYLLKNILDKNNKYNVADHLIFPIFFNLTHGLECWLKASISSITFLYNDVEEFKFTHELKDLISDLKKLLERYNILYIFNDISSFALIDSLIDEFDQYNVRFDFARYSSYRNNSQFYCGSKNVCVDLYELHQFILTLVYSFRLSLSYLILCIDSTVQPDKEGFLLFLENKANYKDNKDDEDAFENFILKDVTGFY